MQTTMQELIPLLTNTQIAVAFLGIVVLSLVENLHPFFDFWRSSKTKRNGHYLKNLSIGLINALVITLFFSGLWLWATIWSDQHTFGLLHWLEPFFGNFESPLRMLLAILFFDFWMYTWHRINHAIPFLWRFHKVHHSDWQPETDSNFGTLFSFWDSLFGTFRIRKNIHEIQLGLKEFKSEDSQRLDSIMKMPLKK